MEEISLIVKVSLILLFFSSIAYSFHDYEEKREPIRRFSAAMDFSILLKNHVLCLRVGEMPHPGLFEYRKLRRYNYVRLARFWNKPYHWQVVVRDQDGGVIFEEGDLTQEGKDHYYLEERNAEFSVFKSMVAIKGEDRMIRPGWLEVWVWSSY
jgi:hypothetical protein